MNSIKDEQPVFLQCPYTAHTRRRWGITVDKLVELFDTFPVTLGHFINEIFNIHDMYLISVQ